MNKFLIFSILLFLFSQNELFAKKKKQNNLSKQEVPNYLSTTNATPSQLNKSMPGDFGKSDYDNGINAQGLIQDNSNSFQQNLDEKRDDLFYKELIIWVVFIFVLLFLSTTYHLIVAIKNNKPNIVFDYLKMKSKEDFYTAFKYFSNGSLRLLFFISILVGLYITYYGITISEFERSIFHFEEVSYLMNFLIPLCAGVFGFIIFWILVLVLNWVLEGYKKV